MSKRKLTAVVSILFVLSWMGIGFTAELKDIWGDFLHYAKIGRFDLAKANAQVILDGSADPEALFNLAEESPQDYQFLLRIREAQSDPELMAMADKILALVGKGGQARRADAKMILQEVYRLASPAELDRMTAIRRLRESGEYSVPFLLDALADPARMDQLDRIVEALPQIGTPAIQPLGTAIQTVNAGVRVEAVRALGKIGSPEVLPYLKYVLENEKGDEIRNVAAQGIQRIDPAALDQTAATLFFRLAERYYNQTVSAGPGPGEAETANVWLWDANQQRLVRKPVDSRIFHELMAMRCCEWALRADDTYGPAIGLWVAGFLKAEAAGGPMSDYFGDGHAGAFVYGTTAGPEVLHQALARAIRDGDASVALGSIEALIVTAGEKSILMTIGSMQPLLQALTFQDRAVRTVAAIAVAMARPGGHSGGQLMESPVVVENLAEAVAWNLEPNALADPKAGEYALRSAEAMLRLAEQRNMAFDLSIAQEALVKAAQSGPMELRSLAIQVLAYIGTSGAQQTLADMALNADNGQGARIEAFESMATSAKVNGSLLADQVLNAVYDLIRSKETDPPLRVAAATAYGALNLPRSRIKDLILDQARN